MQDTGKDMKGEQTFGEKVSNMASNAAESLGLKDKNK